MPSLILHIGTAKTGTKAIQHFLAWNRQQLAAQDVEVPDIDTTTFNHRWLVFLAQDENKVDAYTLRAGLGERVEERRRNRQRLYQQLRERAAGSAETRWIISSEHLHSRLDLEDLRRLQELLVPSFERIEILVYLRHPLATAISAWSTKVKNGLVCTSLMAPQACAPICHHNSRLRAWQQIFGAENLHVRLYQPSAFVGGGLIEDFCAACAISLDRSFAVPGVANRSLSFLALKVLAHLRNVYAETWRPAPPASPSLAPLANATPSAWHWYELAEFVARQLADFPVYRPSRAEHDLYAAFYHDSDLWVQQEFFAGRPLWHDGAPVVREEGDPRFRAALSAEEQALAGMLAELWRERCQRPPQDGGRES
ncbi:MAG: hypothetical protein VKJ05_07670 [Synechococcaceae cyanobacterium]|nr:hypothetical protein [Synechococcaceae cyanobacterium]